MPIGQLLVEEEIQQLPIKTATFNPGAILFNRGSEVDSLPYLIRGNVYLEANNGTGQEITAGTLKAMFPLSAGDFHPLTGIAKTSATLIYVPISILRLNRGFVNPLQDKWQAGEQLLNNTFFNRFYHSYQHETLRIPCFPDVALKLRKATQQNCGTADVVKIINLDPAISAKLIKVVNSPVYRTVNPITNCQGAVNRLGLVTTRNLVTAFSMRNLITSNKPIIKKRIHDTWLQSIRISGISHTLARLVGDIDPEEALLAGLLHNIGVLPLLMFAENLPAEELQLAEMETCIDELQGTLGASVLEQWGFPPDFASVPRLSNQWFAQTGSELTVNDIVLLARYHHQLATGAAELPVISTVSAFQKLGNQTLTPEMSLQLLQDARQQIAQTMKFFVR